MNKFLDTYVQSGKVDLALILRVRLRVKDRVTLALGSRVRVMVRSGFCAEFTVTNTLNDQYKPIM